MAGTATGLPPGYNPNLIPTPTITGPIPNEPFSSPTKNYEFFASDVALASYGFVEQEFYVEGYANAYNAPSSAPGVAPATWTLASILSSNHYYKTRMVVRRPTDPAKFNGTVIVEWFNVTDNIDGEYFWVQAHHLIERAGYAYIGISAQNNGISAPITGLKAFSPTRYGTLDVTCNGSSACAGDRLSYDIFSQAAKAAYDAPLVMGGLLVKNTIGVGMSQSCSRMGAYADYIHLLAPIYDAFIMQVCTGAIRPDLQAPLIKVLSEHEISVSALNNDQPDTLDLKTYWIAGSNHGDSTQRLGRTSVKLRDLGPQNTANDACGTVRADQPYGNTPTRTRTTFRHVLNAAVYYLKRQIETGVQPPSGPRFIPTGIASNPVVRDSFGNAVGGIRTAYTDVPTAEANGSLCTTIGGWIPFTTAQLQALYPTHHDYVTKVKAAVDASVAAGFVLPEDAVETIAEAEASVVGTGLECGPLCLSVWHWRPVGTTIPAPVGTMATPFSSTGLLRDHTVYLNIKHGNNLIADLDEAHRFMAAGYSAVSAPGRHATGKDWFPGFWLDSALPEQYFEKAQDMLRKYLHDIADAQKKGNLTATAAGVLSQQAEFVLAEVIMGPQAMERDLKVMPGDTLSVGFDFAMPRKHPAATLSFWNVGPTTIPPANGGTVTFQAQCVSGVGGGTIVVPMTQSTYTDPVYDGSDWLPSGDQHSPLVYQGSMAVPDLCAGGQMTLKQGGTFDAQLQSTDTTDEVHIRWHYSANGSAGDWSRTTTVVPAF